MRTLVDIDEQRIRALDGWARSAKRARAALIREAIGEYLRRRRDEPTDDAFGAWGEGPDGVTYQQALRAEW